MKVSLDWIGCYTEHKDFFDAMAIAMQAAGHEVGIITGEREGKREAIVKSLGFTPSFLRLWGEFETISNGGQWKAERLLEENVNMHFDDDAVDVKKWTDGWVIKTMNSAQMGKF